jgi:hypothetical protein
MKTVAIVRMDNRDKQAPHQVLQTGELSNLRLMAGPRKSKARSFRNTMLIVYS